MIYLHKIIPLITSPLFFTLTLLAISIVLRKSKFIKLKSFLIFLSFLTLFIFSNPLISNKFIKYIERPYHPVKLSEVPVSDYIVVLSGMLHQVGDENYSTYEFSDPDRFFGGLDLIKEDKSDKIIFTAGQLPWTNNWDPEGIVLKDKAISLGVPQSKILVTEKVKNTYEESFAVTKLLPNNSSIILVTSAYHMDRSKYLFEKQGFEVTPFSVDFKSFDTKISILSFISLCSIVVLSKSFVFQYDRENLEHRLGFVCSCV